MFLRKSALENSPEHHHLAGVELLTLLTGINRQCSALNYNWFLILPSLPIPRLPRSSLFSLQFPWQQGQQQVFFLRTPHSLCYSCLMSHLWTRKPVASLSPWFKWWAALLELIQLRASELEEAKQDLEEAKREQEPSHFLLLLLLFLFSMLLLRPTEDVPGMCNAWVWGHHGRALSQLLIWGI